MFSGCEMRFREPQVVAGYFLRRAFWLKLYDRALLPDGPYRTGTPAEGVHPRTVRPGVAGEVTDRAFYGRRR